MDPLNCIELTLKTPNQRFNDIQLKCQEDWTIKNLKEHLQDVYPSKPVYVFKTSSLIEYLLWFHRSLI